MAKHKVKRPRLVDTVRYGEELASLKRNKPQQWARLQAIAKRRGVTVPALVSGAPAALQERTPAGIRRQATKTIAAAYEPQAAALSRRERANAALATKQSQDAAAYRMWLDGQVGLLRAQAGAADVALQKTHARINDDLVKAQAATAQEMAASLASVKGGDPTQSKALAAVPAAQAQGLERVAAAREHSATLQGIGAESMEVANAALLATASTQEALNHAAENKRAGELGAARTDLAARRGADTLDLELKLDESNRATAQAAREFNLAASQLGLKRQELGLDLKKARLDYKLKKREFNFKVWQEKNKVQADRLKRKIEYDKIASREGIAAADRALRQEAERWDQAHPNAGSGGGGGTTAGERKDSRQTYNDIQTAKTILAAKLGRMSERQARLEMIRNQGVSDVVVDVALDLLRHNGKLSRAGVRKAKAAGVLRPLKLWELADAQNQNGVSSSGSDAAQG